MIAQNTATFDNTFAFTPHYFETPYCHLHYVYQGTGEPLVLVHGDPTWG